MATPISARLTNQPSMDWDKLKVFHAAAEAGSFTHAGEQLGLSQSAVSRQVSALESGQRLLQGVQYEPAQPAQSVVSHFQNGRAALTTP